MLNVIINEGIYDKDFVAKWVHGFDELKARVQDYPVDKVAAITEVPASEIVAAARLFANAKQGGDPLGRADRHVSGRHRGRACDHLPVGRSPAISTFPAARSSRGRPMASPPIHSRPRNWCKLYGSDLIKRLNEKRIGADKYPMVKNFRGWAQPDMVDRPDRQRQALSDQGGLDPDRQRGGRAVGARRVSSTRR